MFFERVSILVKNDRQCGKTDDEKCAKRQQEREKDKRCRRQKPKRKLSYRLKLQTVAQFALSFFFSGLSHRTVTSTNILM